MTFFDDQRNVDSLVDDVQQVIIEAAVRASKPDDIPRSTVLDAGIVSLGAAVMTIASLMGIDDLPPEELAEIQTDVLGKLLRHSKYT